MAGTGMKGMDIEQGQQVVQQIMQWIERCEQLVNSLQTIIEVLTASWHGPDSTAAIAAFEAIVQAVKQLIDTLTGKQNTLEKNISDQMDTSSR